MTEYRLSVVAQFDDLVRNRKVLTEGIESEFLKFALNQEECIKRWQEAEQEMRELRSKVKMLDSENTALETHLKHARSQIEHEIRKRRRIEQDRDGYCGQIMVVKELLSDKNHSQMLSDKERERLPFLQRDYQFSTCGSPQGPLPPIGESDSITDISYDKTEEDLDTSYLRSGRKYKRPSAPPMENETPPPDKKQRKKKKHRRSRSAVVTTTQVNTLDGTTNVQSEVTMNGQSKKIYMNSARKNNMKHYHSDSMLKENDATEMGAGDYADGYYDSDENNRGFGDMLNSEISNNKYYTPPPPKTPGMKHYNSAGKSLNRPHVFVSKTVLMPETCIPCGKKIRFGRVAMKCKDCRATAHQECKELVPLPCVPTLTPSAAKLSGGLIADYSPLDPPMIPALVIHCVNEVESRGLHEVGIYRVPGSEREVKDLKEKFLRGKGTPNLSHVDDIHVVCGCLKDFLRGLKEPLVTYRLWSAFVNAAENQDTDESLSAIYQAISELPTANRDTVAFLILHLQRVSECSECKMPAPNLARVFGPTMIGYSTAEPEPIQMINETKKQQMVIVRLMSISSDYWSTFINIDDDMMYPRESATPQTPERNPVPHSILGPVGTPGRRSTVEHKSSTWYNTPRTTSHKPISKKHFFASPDLH